MSKIAKVTMKEVLNSRGQWTLMAYVESADGYYAKSYLSLGRSLSPFEPKLPNLHEIREFVSIDLVRYLKGKDVEDLSSIDDIIKESYKKRAFLAKLFYLFQLLRPNWQL